MLSVTCAVVWYGSIYIVMLACLVCFHTFLHRQIMTEVSRRGFAVDLSEVKDGLLGILLQGLLEPDSNKRIRYFDSSTMRLALL